MIKQGPRTEPPMRGVQLQLLYVDIRGIRYHNIPLETRAIKWNIQQLKQAIRRSLISEIGIKIPFGVP